MLRTAGWLALPRRALSAGFDGGISPPFQFVAAQLLGGWDLTETRLSLASPTRLLWTHTSGPHSGKPSRPIPILRNLAHTLVLVLVLLLLLLLGVRCSEQAGLPPSG